MPETPPPSFLAHPSGQAERRSGYFRWCAYALLCGTALAWPFALFLPQALAQGTDDGAAVADAVSPELPVILQAEQVNYDREAGVVTAAGKVDITQGQTILLADRVVYDQKQNRVRAEGNVTVLEASGNVYFAESADLSQDMSKGVVQQFKARLSDNSLFAAREARKISEARTELSGAVYSPCSVRCDDGTSKTPLWQIKADDVRVDEAEEEVVYHNAFFELYGVPVFYTPYMSHPTPDAGNKSGLLTPEYRHSDSLGSVYTAPVYLALAPDYDLTLTPIFTSQEGLVMAGEYRQLFSNGVLNLRGSATRPRDRDALGNPSPGSTWRGHINASGGFQLTPDWRSGFSIHRASDDTYLRRYEFDEYATVLTSRAYAEGFNLFTHGRLSYATIEGLSFQGLTQQDDADRMPLIAPLARVDYQSDALAYGSRLTLSSSLMSLMRRERADSRRFSASGAWSLPYVTEGGHIFEFTASLRADAYYVNDVLRANNTLYDGETGRVIPQATAGWRYPLINRIGSASLIIEPVVNATLSPRGGNPDKIPNEDSATPEFSDLNFFSPNRFPGYDRVETGPRVHYGVRGQAGFSEASYASFMLGQNYRTENDPLFPLTNDLRSRFSDYVGRIGVSYLPVDFSYRFRLDKDGLAPRRQETEAALSLNRITLNAAYLQLDDDPVLGSREEVYGGSSVKLTKHWTALLNARHNLQGEETIGAGAGLVFENECITLTTYASRDLTRDRDVEPDTSFRIRVAFKNLE